MTSIPLIRARKWYIRWTDSHEKGNLYSNQGSRAPARSDFGPIQAQAPTRPMSRKNASNPSNYYLSAIAKAERNIRSAMDELRGSDSAELVYESKGLPPPPDVSWDGRPILVEVADGVKVGDEVWNIRVVGTVEVELDGLSVMDDVSGDGETVTDDIAVVVLCASRDVVLCAITTADDMLLVALEVVEAWVIAEVSTMMPLVLAVAVFATIVLELIEGVAVD